MLYSAVIAKMVKYINEQEKSRVILRDLLIMLLPQVKRKYKCNYFDILFINILSSQYSLHDVVVNIISII